MIFIPVFKTNDEFGFPIVNSPWLRADVPRLPSYDICISQLICFARCCTGVLGFNHKNLVIISILLSQDYIILQALL